MDSPLNILVVEDHDDLREVTIAALSEMGHQVRGVPCAEEINEALSSFRPQLMVLDLNLPGEDGLSVAKRMRDVLPDLRIIMVTARNRSTDFVTGYNSGADIYLAKPTDPAELKAAVNALARRLQPNAGAAILTLNTKAMMLSGPSQSIDVSESDTRILTALSQASDGRLETWQLLELLGKDADDNEKKALVVHITRLRKKLLDAGAPEPTIKATRGIGYQLCSQIRIKHG